MNQRLKEALKKWESEFLAPYCLKTCQAKCCKSRKTEMTREQALAAYLYAFRQGKISKDSFKAITSFLNTNGERVVIPLNSNQIPHCPALNPETSLCAVYNQRLSSCTDFPFIINGKTVHLSSRCPVKDQKSEIIALKEIISKLGYALVIT